MILKLFYNASYGDIVLAKKNCYVNPRHAKPVSQIQAREMTEQTWMLERAFYFLSLLKITGSARYSQTSSLNHILDIDIAQLQDGNNSSGFPEKMV